MQGDAVIHLLRHRPPVCVRNKEAPVIKPLTHPFSQPSAETGCFVLYYTKTVSAAAAAAAPSSAAAVPAAAAPTAARAPASTCDGCRKEGRDEDVLNDCCTV